MELENPLLRCLIVDDESLARLQLRRLLGAFPGVQIAAEAGDAMEAERLARLHRPEVIFLDVPMPSVDGFTLIERLEAMAHIVLVTSFDRYALRGFEINALDYILKPVMPERLALTIQRIRQASPKPKSALDALVIVTDSERTRATSVGAIAAIQAEGNYSRLHTITDSHSMLMLRSLSEWQALVPSPPFIRVDRSLILNLTHIQEFTPLSRNEARLHLKGSAAPLALGRTAASRLRAALRGITRPD